MAGNKYIALVSGRKQEVASIQSSAGVGDAGKIPALDTAGKLDVTMMPVGVVADSKLLVAFENLTAGDFVNVFDDGGTAKARKADAATAGKEVDGFVLASVSTAANATVFFEGTNTQLSGLTLGARYYLSAATAGLATATPPSTASNVVQYIGRAVSATELSFEPDDGVVLA